MKTQFVDAPRSVRWFRRKSGFALVVTLSLMILLTIIAVGLLSLSGVSLRATVRNSAMQEARANARVALMLAIGDLQKQLGPDTRISTTADQIPGSDPAESKVAKSQRNWTGAYKSWAAGQPTDARPAPEFLQWFVSGAPNSITRQSFPETTVSGSSVEIVTANSVGPNGNTVRVPMITRKLSNGTIQNIAWWVSDLGTKALVAASKDLPPAVAEARADLQSAPAFNIRNAASGGNKPFAKLSLTDPDLAKLSSWRTSEFLADNPDNLRGLFHDLTTTGRGLLTNVRSGGFRKDLSMELERPASGAPNSTSTALYKVGGETGINLQELWVHYNLYKEIRKSGAATYTTGGSLTSGTPYLMVDASPSACQNDDEFYQKQPVVISYQSILSFETRPATVSGRQVQRLHLVIDPVITLWNPLDIPVSIPLASYLTVKYWQIPYSFEISINGGQTKSYAFAGIWRSQRDIDETKAGRPANGDGNIVSLEMGRNQQLVFKPGEVIKFSQTGNSLVKGTSPVDHALAGKAGFNYGGGVSLPIRDIDGTYIDLNPADTINYACKPNNLTAGKTAQSGNSLLNTPTNHTRHFSLTHHEYYVGADRESGGDSLGIGNMAIDWDFGNRRLKATENRGASSPGAAGTKNPADRIYANNSKYSGIFRKIEGKDTRQFVASAINANKQPIMLVSFNAKTEKNSIRGTRFLSRLNPRALHVDFYDLTESERDLLPYEYIVEPLLSWKNDKLEVSSNGSAYFGGGMNASDGTSAVMTHSVPREPIVSLAAFQHSAANGFDILKPKYGYATINAREPMMPQIAHAIGNSVACPVLPASATTGTLAGGRPLADHSYLANQALWDEWFLSGIAPQNSGTFAKSRTQKTVATDFFSSTAKLPVARYQPNTRGQAATQLVNSLIPSTTPSAAATLNTASYLQVAGMFNVNSTSVEAWKCLLGALKERSIATRDTSGKEVVKSGGADTSVAGLLTPVDVIAPGKGNVDVQSAAQWIGRRTLTDEEIDSLARAIVREVRKRGPFLSLADFLNRRVGPDADLARGGAIQSALDSNEVPINSAYRSGGRAVSSAASSRFVFPKAEEGPLALGAPGVVKQADILTPIAPVLSARSDSFLIRAYGEQTDSSGNVTARAWCEAVVERGADFVDPADRAEKTYSAISNLNKSFGRRFQVTSFRWLDSNDA